MTKDFQHNHDFEEMLPDFKDEFDKQQTAEEKNYQMEAGFGKPKMETSLLTNLTHIMIVIQLKID